MPDSKKKQTKQKKTRTTTMVMMMYPLEKNIVDYYTVVISSILTCVDETEHNSLGTC